MTSLTDLTRAAVLGAVRRFDDEGRQAFLSRRGYRPALRHVLAIGPRRYPSKAIVGAALDLAPQDFSGGQATVARQLRKLGFSVIDRAKRGVVACLSPLYMSVPPTASRKHWKAVLDGRLAVITTPHVGSARVAEWPIWAADNGCFAAGERFDLEVYYAWLRRWQSEAARCVFATAPDVLCDAGATWERSAPVLPQLRQLGYPAALVAQNGIDQVDWGAIDCLFVGGDDDFKSCPVVCDLVAEANRRGVWTHCGRVNSEQRLRQCAHIGFDSADGTFVAYAPDENVVRIERWYDRMHAQPSLF